MPRSITGLLLPSVLLPGMHSSFVREEIKNGFAFAELANEACELGAAERFRRNVSLARQCYQLVVEYLNNTKLPSEARYAVTCEANRLAYALKRLTRTPHWLEEAVGQRTIVTLLRTPKRSR